MGRSGVVSAQEALCDAISDVILGISLAVWRIVKMHLYLEKVAFSSVVLKVGLG